ncbi:MAG TPA: serine hydrolase [Caulobacteraceae bacterium]|jgi:CubicO group peptidase (beta-lactamase class C family)|nr:serine hydrolase [Caulobacteraceae bacterium]
MTTALAPLPTQDPAVPWPTSQWPTAGLPPRADAGAIETLFGEAFGPGADPDLGETHAALAVHAGRIVLERYGEGQGPDVTCRSWSMAKSITQALVGIAVGDGLIDIHAPANVPAWRESGDPRGVITLDHLLRMSSGLAWIEDYVPGSRSDVIEMLMGSGAADVAGFAGAMPLAHEPGSFFYYSSGTTNIVCGILARTLGLRGEAFEAWMRERLFAPIGMTSPKPRFDAAGTFIGSSFCFCTPRDFARFGLLYLRDGVWDGRRLLPEGWVDYARTPTFQQPGGDVDGAYGAHWWLDSGSFAANGYEGQFIVCIPSRDLVVMRNGVTPLATKAAARAWTTRLIGAL